MATEFKLPELGENIESGDVVNVLVSEGDSIDANDAAFELETDKAVIEVPCPYAGRISKVHVGKGDTVKVGQAMLTVDTGDGQADEPDQEAKPTDDDGGESPKSTDDDGGESPKSTDEDRGKSPKPTDDDGGESPKPTDGIGGKSAGQARPLNGNEPLPAGPAARRIARELGVELSRVRGSGERGRITIEDVQAAADGAGQVAPGGPEPVEPPGEAGQDDWGEVRRDRLTRIRRSIADQMSRSASTIPHVTNFDDADVTDLEQLRRSVPDGYLGQGVKLTAMPFVIRAVTLALQQHPMLNASLDDEQNQIVYKRYVNMGIAVDTPRGLVVPKLRNTERTSVPQLARELSALAGRVRDADFTVEELRGGTFTISNLGAIGGQYSTPIINHPEVAILLLGRSRQTPVVRDGQITQRTMMPLSLSYDHRLVDGATAGRFLNDVIAMLQSPAKLLLAG